jgi:hypothetical protein
MNKKQIAKDMMQQLQKYNTNTALDEYFDGQMLDRSRIIAGVVQANVNVGQKVTFLTLP